MNKNITYCATDLEIFDVLMASKQRITEAILFELARDRGIFYSTKDSRESVIDKISTLPHDYNDLASILEQREHTGRAEKLTSTVLEANITIEEIKEAVKDIILKDRRDDTISAQPIGSNRYKMQVNYSEVDYSKTRLIQRRPKEADIELIVEQGKTIVRMPCSQKAKDILEEFKQCLDKNKKTTIPVTEISLTRIAEPEYRTKFYTELIKNLPGYVLENVTTVRVERFRDSEDDGSIELEDDQEAAEAEREALSFVKKVALSGNTLLASEEYQSLQKKEFFITAIIWRSRNEKEPYTLIEFEASFEDPVNGKGFKYSIRGGYNQHDGEYTKTIRPVDAKIKDELYTLIEQTASKTVSKIYQEMDSLSSK